MANYLSDRTGASIDQVLDNADTGGIGRDILDDIASDANNYKASGFYRVPSGISNIPQGFGVMTVNGRDGANNASQMYLDLPTDSYFFRSFNTATWGAWQELYHTGNTGVVGFGGSTPDGTSNEIELSVNGGSLSSSATNLTSGRDHWYFVNPNGIVGGISTSGTATSFNTSSDPRLKVFAPTPTDSAINAEFNSLFSCFRTFNWKSDLQGDLVWGFDAHACIDANTGIGSEGEGPRNLALGDTYGTIPAVTESRVVMDSEGNPTSEVETVVITPAINKKVSPAGVDQSKAVPILLAKIEQLERRLTAAGL